ncbi:hypothetical protein XENOCAPTIV_029999 [Xenoophorus captivus]|uniref:Uncharacterized protein n=1 Tax=Xenoophorus captivus TaxID=1517983 RepID=A0ABV0Q7S5_9TELE
MGSGDLRADTDRQAWWSEKLFRKHDDLSLFNLCFFVPTFMTPSSPTSSLSQVSHTYENKKTNQKSPVRVKHKGQPIIPQLSVKTRTTHPPRLPFSLQQDFWAALPHVCSEVGRDVGLLL